MSRRLSRIRPELRQRRHHRAFRIAVPDWDESAYAHFSRVLAEIGERGELPEPLEPPRDAAPRTSGADLDEKSLADATTNLWRAQRRLARPGDDVAARTRQTGRYLHSCREALLEAGLMVQDHDGEPHHPGRSVEVVAFRDDPSLTTETIVETIRPSIYFQDRRIQMGQVIIGVPVRPDPAPRETT